MIHRGVSYIPYSQDLSHPADRRRVKIWSEEFKVPLNHQSVNPRDLLILSASANLKYWTMRHKGPVVIDLVDGYLSSKTPIIEDILRNTLRATIGKSSFSSFTFSNELKAAIRRANAVVVSCPEQATNISYLNSNIHCILDNHSELIQEQEIDSSRNREGFTILWEGLGYTLKHLTDIASSLGEFLTAREARLIVVTNNSFKKFAAKFGHVNVASLLQRKFGDSWGRVELVDWSVNNLKKSSLESDLAIIPINAKDGFAMAKPENKLLSFWTLGLPVLCSPTPAYKRVLSEIGFEHCLVEESRWANSLGNFHDTQLRKSEGNLGAKSVTRSYLEKYHSKKILSNKWESVLRPLL